ncbi:MAG: dihydrodipicolinate synthase family protein [Acidobacteriota bacterium]
MDWTGVIPAVTTPFDADLKVDHAFLARHCRWMVEHGCSGIVALGSLGEAATLTCQEKLEILSTCIQAVGGQVPVAAGISALSTAEAADLARQAESQGCRGLMVLPPYVYKSDWREMKAHLVAIFQATELSCMLYNNPVAYGTDFVPEQVAELASEFGNLQAVKESSTDVRRITAIRALIEDRLQILVGIDDAIVEGIDAGAVGWIAGLVNAFPAESVALFDAARQGRRQDAFEIYRWFLPLLRLDTVPKFVQLIKLVQEEVGMGSARVRPPRLELTDSEVRQVQAILGQALESRSSLPGITAEAAS